MARFLTISRPKRSLVRAVVLCCGLWWLPAAGAAAEEAGAIHAVPPPPDLKFEVTVNTASGSASASPEAAPVPVKPKLPAAAPAEEITIELLGAASGSGGVAAAPAPAPSEGVAMAPSAPGTVPGGSSPSLPPLAAAPSPGAAGEPMSPERQAVFAALDQWHQANLANYNYTIASLYDPFMPIKEVRGKPDELGEELDPEEEAKLPPILKLELSQLKLVAITSLTGRSGAALASFEDGAGSSYILRQSDRIGRRQGRIVRIDPTQVIVEEPPRGSSTEPQVTVLKLDALDQTGLSYTNGGN